MILGHSSGVVASLILKQMGSTPVSIPPIIGYRPSLLDVIHRGLFCLKSLFS